MPQVVPAPTIDAEFEQEKLPQGVRKIVENGIAWYHYPDGRAVPASRQGIRYDSSPVITTRPNNSRNDVMRTVSDLAYLALCAGVLVAASALYSYSAKAAPSEQSPVVRSGSYESARPYGK